MSTTVPEIVIVEDAAALAEQAADRFAQIVHDAITRRGRATVALSGGSTPRALFQLLAAPPYRDAIDWSKLQIFWGDERTVPPEHEESNYRMAQEALLSQVPIPAEQIHRMHGELDPWSAADDYERQLVAVFGEGETPSFDLMLLGIGTDGHTASLFPNTAALDEQDRLCSANEVVQLDTTRLTLTVPVLLAASNVLVLAAGADKAEAVALAIEGPENIEETPSQVLRQATGTVTWMLDQAAAGQLRADRGA